jgi:hypothetical protein
MNPNILDNNFQENKIKNIQIDEDISNTQNFVPIYKEFLDINAENCELVKFETNYTIEKFIEVDYSFMKCTINGKDKDIFCKYAPIIDPIRYMMGKYTNVNELYLPNSESKTDTKYDEKINRLNNCAYIDGLFTYLSSVLHKKGFKNCIEFYGMNMAKHHNYKINVADEIEFLDKSSFFHNNLDKLFFIDDSIFETSSTESGKNKKNPIEIIEEEDVDIKYDVMNHDDSMEILTLESSLEEINITSAELNDCIKLKEESDDDDDDDDDDDEDEDDDDDDDKNYDADSDTNEPESESQSDEKNDSSSVNSDDESEISTIESIIKDFPVLMIYMEKCDYTLDFLIENEEISIHEWCAYLMQIIMTLILYQKAFNFTHNDLHASNVMYTETEEVYLYYKFDGVLYRVPTYNKIFKIIDFGRSIYNVKDKLFYSDNFLKDEDAYTQYNFGPIYDSNKVLIENNFSFDLSRLGCSLYDYFKEEDFENQQDANELIELVSKWCSDDNKKNLLYTNKGEERFPDFKLYRMIAKNVHHCVPHEELKNPLFQQFKMNNVDSSFYIEDFIMNIDEINKN